jgi:predicted nucleic acid-binding protein
LAYYEVKRGLSSVGSTVRLRLFEKLCRDFTVDAMDTATWDKAVHLYAIQRQCGFPVEEADIFIAAFCLVGGYTLVTNNTKHFEMFEILPDVSFSATASVGEASEKGIPALPGIKSSFGVRVA